MKALHPIANRIFHWVMFFLVILFIYSGIMIYWANAEYAIKIGKFTIFSFFPNSVFSFLKLDRKLALAMATHFSMIIPFTVFCFSYLIYMIFSGGMKFYFKTSPKKKLTTKYNTIQGLAYFGVFGLLFACLISGFAIYKPSKMDWLCELIGGYQMARLFHFTATIFLVLFILVHVSQVIMAGWRTFFAIIVGEQELPWEKVIPVMENSPINQDAAEFIQTSQKEEPSNTLNQPNQNTENE